MIGPRSGSSSSGLHKRPNRTSPGSDLAAAQVLEAMVIGVVVMGATFAAVSLQAPPSAQQNEATEQTRSKTYTALTALDDLYIDDGGYNHSALSYALAQAAAGNTTPLVDSIEPFLPADSSFCVHLNNGERAIEIYCPEDPPGAAVGVSYPIEPNWRFHYAEPDLRYYDETSQTMMGVTEIPILNAHTVLDEGDYARATVDGTQEWAPGQARTEAGSASFSETAFSTLLQGDTSTEYPSAAVYLQCQRSWDNDGIQPCYASDLTREMRGYDPFGEGEDGDVLRFTVNNSGPGPVPTETELEVSFPSGMDVVHANVSSPFGGFDNSSITVEGEDSAPETISAEIANEVATNETIHLDVEVNVTDERYAFRHVDARLADGAVSSSQLLLRVADKEEWTHTGGDSRVPMISTPKPAGSATATDATPEGRWGIVLPIPIGDTRLEKLTFQMEHGDEVLANVEWPSLDSFNPPSATGDNTVETVRHGKLTFDSPTGITWEAPPQRFEYTGYTFAEFQFIVESDGSQTQASPYFPFAQPEADLEGYDPPPQSIQTQPGMWWKEYPPDSEAYTIGATKHCTGGCPGYEDDYTLDSSNPTATGAMDAYLNWRGVPLNGSTEYKLADLKQNQREGLKDALQATDVSTSPHRLAPGDSVRVHVDAEDLAHFIAETSNVADMDLVTSVYAPWGIRNRTPVETFNHQVVAGRVSAPNDLLALHVNGDLVEDVLAASTDGNVYALHGDSGEKISGRAFGVPEASGIQSAEPIMLDHGFDDEGNSVIAVGTNAEAENHYTIDGDLEERWRGLKPNKAVTTYSAQVGEDITSDGVPEVIFSTPATEGTSSDRSRLTVWEGADLDGDGVGHVLPGFYWSSDPQDDVDLSSGVLDLSGSEEGVVVPGKATELGTAWLGVRGEEGVYANTGMEVATNTEYVIKRSTAQAVENNDPEAFLDESLNATAKINGAGLLGFTKHGQQAFNLSGMAAVRAQTVEAITEGSNHSGIAIGDSDGWVWGLNASNPVYPVHGWSVGNTRGYTDLSMGNAFEGYMASEEGFMLGTRSGWTDYKYYVVEEADDQWIPELGARSVDTPDGSYLSGASNVSWWAGEAGSIFRSPDYLETIERKGTTAVVTGVLDGSADLLNPDLDGASTLDLTEINFHAVEAISEEEAWFTGTGLLDADKDGNGYIVHTANAGDSFTVTEVDCGSEGCGFNDITNDGERLWVAGGNGTVLVHNVSGMAPDIRPQEASIDDRGRVDIAVSADEQVTIDNLSMMWDPTTKFAYGQAATLAETSGEDRDLWNATKGCKGIIAKPYTEDSTCSQTWGFDHGNTLLVRDYVQHSNDGDNRTLLGEGNLTVGPFVTSALEGYKDQAWYEDPDNLPVTFHVEASFSDGTRDIYSVHINETAVVNATETSSANWTHPDDLPGDEAFTMPECVGETVAGCPTLNSINVTNVGTPEDPSLVGVISADVGASGGAPLYGLSEGTRTWEPIQTPVASTFHDATVSPSEPDRWVAVGEEGRTLVSYDGGDSWRPVPETADHLVSVDHTNPDVPALAGGSGVGERFTMNGYVQDGSAVTDDLYDESEHEGAMLEQVEFDSLPTIHVDSDETPVEVQVWDEGMDDGSGGWGTLYTTAGGEETYTFEEATDEVRLRFLLEVEDVVRFSPMLVGDLTINGYTNADPMLAVAPIPIDLDLGDAGAFQDVSLVDHSAENSYIRLHAARNPWITQLGNTEAGDWSAVRNGSVGARVADMGLAPNGSTIWVLTESIYHHGAGEDDPPVQDAGCETGGALTLDCHDNSLYAIDASTGQQASWWEPIHFSKTPQMLSVGSQAVSVATGNSTEEPRVYWIEIDDADKSHYREHRDSLQMIDSLITADAFPTNTPSDDPIAAIKDLGGGDGNIKAYKAPDIKGQWTKMPMLDDQFDFSYEVPEDALYGSRVVTTEVKWQIEDQYDTDLVQSARLHDTFDVTPKGERMPLSPTYTLEVVAWIDDWR